jgi:hypothetical protein
MVAPQRRSIASPSSCAVAGGITGAVRLKRGAGAGCTTPPTFAKVPRATLCGCAGASSQSSTGAKQASLPSSSTHHSSRVRVRNRSAMRSLSSGQRSASICASKAVSSAMPQRSRSSA